MNLDIELISIISALTAFAAVALGPLVAVHVVKKQINADTVSKNRQQWINTLRCDVAEYVTHAAIMALSGSDSTETHIKIEKAYLLLNKIKLLTNPVEEDHLRLNDLLKESAKYAAGQMKARRARKAEAEFEIGIEVKAEDRDYADINRDIVSQCQLILKEEWERVKSGR